VTTLNHDVSVDQPLVVVVDTNVMLHCKPLAELPWAQLGVGRVDVLLVDPVLAELDAWKSRGNDARAKRARSLGSLLRKLLESEELRIDLVGHHGQVRLMMPSADQPTPVLGDADGAIVSAAEQAAAGGANVLLLTRDVVMALRARRRGVTYRLLRTDDADWNQKAEPIDPDHAETARKLKEYERQRPELSAVASGIGAELGDKAMTIWVPAAAKKFEIGDVVRTWAAEEFEKPRWRDRDLENDYWNRQLARLDKDVTLLVLKRIVFGPIINLAIHNEGSVNAEHVQIELMTEGDWRLRSELLELRVEVPTPPREDRYDALTHVAHNFPIISGVSPSRDDEPEWVETETKPIEGTTKLVARIPVLLHRSEARLQFHLGPVVDTDTTGKLIARISSARQPGFKLATWVLNRHAPACSRDEVVTELMANGELSFHPEKA
jgi:rRNA-processing protein FCF1